MARLVVRTKVGIAVALGCWRPRPPFRRPRVEMVREEYDVVFVLRRVWR